jgi:N-acyl amino acid synthase of PEP-CTERM/exosortase system
MRNYFYPIALSHPRNFLIKSHFAYRPDDKTRDNQLANYNNFIDAFNQYFEMVPAFSDELKNEVYKLRYHVYCVENEFLNSEDYPDNLEIDDYDQQSVHYLIRHRKSGDYAATTRLILPDADNPEKLFPLEQYCKIDNFAVMKSIKREQLGEVSRFCVSKAFKKRRNEGHTLTAISSDVQDYFTHNERRTFPHITLGLFACCIKASYENNIHYLYAATEQSLFRFVSVFGINLKRIGPVANYHGDRWPSVINVADMLDCIAGKNLELWNLITNKGDFLTTHPDRKTVRKK